MASGTTIVCDYEEDISIEVLNWEKYNPRAFEHRNPYWFRLHSRLYSTPIIHTLTPQSRWCFIVILCLACERRSKVIKGPVSWFLWACGVDRETFMDTLKRLQGETLRVASAKTVQSTEQPTVQTTVPLDKKRIDKIYIPHFANEDEGKGLTEAKRHKKKVIDYEVEYREPFDLLALYLKYPRHLGKSEGLKKAKKEITTPLLYQQLSEAINRFAALMAAERRQAKHIKSFESFMSIWRDYLEEDVGSCSIENEPSNYEVKDAL